MLLWGFGLCTVNRAPPLPLRKQDGVLPDEVALGLKLTLRWEHRLGWCDDAEYSLSSI